MKAKIDDLETNNKIQIIRDLYRGISDIKKGYQPRTNIVKDETGDLVTGSYSILARWREYFSQLLNVHGVHEVRQTETHTAEPLVPEPSAFEVDLAIEKLKSHKSPGVDQIPAELIKEGGRIIRYQIHKLIVSIWNKEGMVIHFYDSQLSSCAYMLSRVHIRVGYCPVCVGRSGTGTGHFEGVQVIDLQLHNYPFIAY